MVARKPKNPTRWIDTSRINHVAVMERYVWALKKQNAVTHGGTYKRPCHFPGSCAGQGDDRLQLYPHRPPMGSTDKHGHPMEDAGPCFWCSICQKSGDILQFIALSEGLDWEIPAERAQILDIAGMAPHEIRGWDGSAYRPAQWTRPAVALSQPPTEVWCTRALSFCKQARDFLCSDHPEAQRVRTWLHEVRGLSDRIIQRNGLGYHLKPEWLVYQEWGLEDEKERRIIPRGLVIPWIVEGQIWQVQIRRENEDLERSKQRAAKEGRIGYEPARYLRVSGGQTCLYGVHGIREGQPLFIVESALDALVGRQETPYAWVATGSTSYGRNPRWTQAIAQASPVLLTFDSDQAGDKAYASFWRKQQTYRWLPWAKDVSEMKREDLSLWARMGLELAQTTCEPLEPDTPATSQEEPTIQAEPIVNPDGEDPNDGLHCFGCKQLVNEFDETSWQISVEGILFCAHCWQSRAIEHAEKAHTWLHEHGLPTDLEERVQAFRAGAGCASCGGRDWIVDAQTGMLMCPCRKSLS